MLLVFDFVGFEIFDIMSRVYHVRYEGNNATTGTTGSPTINIGFNFYESNPEEIRFRILAHSHPNGVTGIYSKDTLITEMSVYLDSLSYVITSTGIDTCTLTRPKGAYWPPLSDLSAVLWEWNNTTSTPSTSADNLNASQDDNYIKLYIPWAVTFLGKSYATGDVYLGSNTYLTFGAGSVNFSSLSESNPPLPKIMIGSGDNSFQRVRASSGAIAIAPSLGVFNDSKTFGTGSFNVIQPSSPSSGAFTYSITSGTEVISISGTTITILKAGSATIQASQAASGIYLAATKTATITITPATPTLGDFNDSRTFGDSPFTITQPSSASSGAFTYSVSSGTGVISISGTTITIASAGTATVQASQAASGNYTAATKDATITINRAAGTLSVTKSIFYQKFVSGASISFDVITSNAGLVSRTHESNNTSIVSIPSSAAPSATIVAPGKIYIKVIQPATNQL